MFEADNLQCPEIKGLSTIDIVKKNTKNVWDNTCVTFFTDLTLKYFYK